MKGGAGDDLYQLAGGKRETLDVSSGGEDTIDATANGGNITGYSASSGAVFTTGVGNLVDAILGGAIKLLGRGLFNLNGGRKGNVRLSNAAAASDVESLVEGGAELADVELFDANDASGTFVNLGDTTGSAALVGFTDSVGGVVDGTQYTSNEILVGNNADTNSGGATLVSGVGDNTIVAGVKDVVSLSGGNDTIEMATRSSVGNYTSGGVIALGNTESVGTAVVTNFVAGYADNADRVKINSQSDLGVDFTDGNLKLVANEKTLEFAGATGSVNELLIDDEKGTANRYAFLKDNATISVDNTWDQSANFYGQTPDTLDARLTSNGTVVDFTNYENELNVNMADTSSTGTNHFYNIAEVKGGVGVTSLQGNDDANTLVAGSGATSIKGNGGRDSLVGNASQTGSTSFFYANGDNLTTIASFQAGTSTTSDKLVLSDNLKNITARGNDIILTLNSSEDDQLILEGMRGQTLQTKVGNNEFVAEVDSAMTYSKNVNTYLGGIADVDAATLNVSGSESQDVWANGWDGNIYYNVKNMNAASATGDVKLAGGDDNTTITGGTGNNSLWGGMSGENVLNAGTGYNEFFKWKQDSNNTTINGADADDIINLLDMEGEDIDWAVLPDNVDSSHIKVNFTNGSSLVVNSSADVRFQMGDGSVWTVNREEKTLNYIGKRNSAGGVTNG